MRFEQIIAAVTRALNCQGIREMLVVDSFGVATDLPRDRHDHPGCCYQSAATGMYPTRAWLSVYAKPAMGRRQRHPLAKRLLGLATGGSSSSSISNG
ncbi:MAG: hypothetical protein AAF745_18835 [Planctomycetota bacterium]